MPAGASGAAVADVSIGDFGAMLELNLTGEFLSMKHEIAPMLAAGGGEIVNLSSGAVLRAASSMGAYDRRLPPRPPRREPEDGLDRRTVRATGS